MTRSHADRHLDRYRSSRSRIISAANRLGALLAHADPASPVTVSYDPGSGSRDTSPTEAQALDRDTRDLDRITATLDRHADRLESDVAALSAIYSPEPISDGDRRSRTPDTPCFCCEDELATHTRKAGGERLDLCAACHDFHRVHDHLCGPETHRHRPKVRWCECPLVCCPSGCSDRAEEGRTMSGRCRKRMHDRRRKEAS